MSWKERDALEGMLIQFGGNFALSAVEEACEVLGHPRTLWVDKESDCCYCRKHVYSKKEMKRRMKDKIPFVNKIDLEGGKQ